MKSGVSAQSEDQDGPGKDERRRGGEGGLHVENAPEGAHQEARDQVADRIDRVQTALRQDILVLGHEFGREGIFEGLLGAQVETGEDENHGEER